MTGQGRRQTEAHAALVGLSSVLSPYRSQSLLKIED